MRGHLCFRAVRNFLTWPLYSNSPRFELFFRPTTAQVLQRRVDLAGDNVVHMSLTVVTRIVATYSVFVCFKQWDFMSSRSQPYLTIIFPSYSLCIMPTVETSLSPLDSTVVCLNIIATCSDICKLRIFPTLRRACFCA